MIISTADQDGVHVITSVPAKDGIYPNIDEDIYHADPHSLSSTGAKLLAGKQPPAVFRDKQLHGWEPTKAFDGGSLVHKIVLGRGPDLVIVDADSWRTKAAQEKRDAARAKHKLPCLAKNYESALLIAQRVMEHDIAGQLFTEGDPEVSMYHTDLRSGVRMRGRVDWMRPDAFVDLKTTTDSDPAAFARSIWKYGYAQQAAWYSDVGRALGHPVEDFIFVSVSMRRPHLITVHNLLPRYIEHGRSLNQLAIERFAWCRDRDEWPGYPSVIHHVDIPDWADPGDYNPQTESEFAA